MSPDTILSRDHMAGVREYVRFTVGGLQYLATVGPVNARGERGIQQLHRVSQEYGGRALGATHDKFTSISVRSKRFERVAGAFWRLLRAHEQEQQLVEEVS